MRTTGSGAGGGGSLALDYSSSESEHCWKAHLEGITDPASQVKVQVHDGFLLVTGGDKSSRTQLPPDAYTATPNGMHAVYQRGTLTVTSQRKDPASPAMQEKAQLDPDRPHPREVTLVLPGAKAAAPKQALPTAHGQPTPAEAELGAGNPELQSKTHPTLHVPMPRGDPAGALATAVPVITNPGGALEAPDHGETVVTSPDAPADAKLMIDPKDVQAAKMAEQMARVSITPATVIGQGGMAGHGKGGAEVAPYPAGPPGEEGGEAYEGSAEEGDEYSEEYNEGEEYDRKEVDYTEEKVGMATRPYEPRDFYAHADNSARDPYTTIDISNEVEGVYKGKGTPYEVTPQETKRRGRPRLNNPSKANYTGHTQGQHDKASAGKKDYRMHAAPRRTGHLGVQKRMGLDVVGNVSHGGEAPVPPPATGAHTGGPNVGGREIATDLVGDRTRTKDLATHLMG